MPAISCAACKLTESCVTFHSYLRRVASICKRRYKGDIPGTVDELCQLPGVGECTDTRLSPCNVNKASISLYSVCDVYSYLLVR